MLFPPTPDTTRCAPPACAGLALALSLLASTAAAAVPCGDWDLIPTPNVGNSVTRLTAITSLAADDAWAVGYWRDAPAGRGPLAIRWNGSSWNLASLPSTDHLGAWPEIAGVDAAPNGDTWFVGNVTTTYPTYNLPLVLRWRGGSWDVAETATLRPQTVYPFAARGGFAYEVDALAPDDVWAVGQAVGFGDGGATSVPLAIHWDGSRWTDVDVPRIANRHHELGDLVMISHDDVWAVGDYRDVAGTYRGVTYHWDGQRWSHIYSPIEAISQSGLDDVVATGPNDVWAIGSGSAGVVLMHWNGAQWSSVQAPPNSGGSMAAVGPNDLWVSGWNGFWHWNGTSWTEVPASVPGASYMLRSGGLEIVGDCDIWSVGFWTLADGITSYTLAERLAAGVGACSPVVTADFSGSPTSGVAPLTANFSDLSTGSPTSWSWNFGDGGTSTAQNPTHVYTAAGVYNVTLTATNACGRDPEVKNAYITVTAPAGWTTITYDNFESGLGSYSDDGADMSRYAGGTYAYEGVAAADIQDNSGTASAFTHKSTHNVSGYTTQEITFRFRAQSMENGEDFWVRYYNGSVWQTVATFVAGTNFVNGTFYSATVTLTQPSYVFPTNARLRFQCDAGDNNDDVYIDAITWRGSSGALGAREGATLVALSSNENAVLAPEAISAAPRVTSLEQNYPNPFKPRTQISFSLAEGADVKLEVFDVSGRRVASLVDGVRAAGRHSVPFDASSLKSGSYFYRLITGGVVEQKRMVLLK